MQRSLASNFDQRLREPQESGKFRHEACCVCCARPMWSEDLSLLILCQDPVLPEAEYYREPDVQSLHGSQQERLCDLLGVERYLQRWPQLAQCPRAKRELQASAVQRPYLQDRYLLLRKKAMPEDTKNGATVCLSCRSSLTSSTVALPRFDRSGQRSMDGAAITRTAESFPRHTSASSSCKNLLAGHRATANQCVST